MLITDKIKGAADLEHIVFKKHALTRMLERGISSDDIKAILGSFIIVEEYYDDKPFPSCLILGIKNDRPIHAVVSYDSEFDVIFIITVYEPAVELWENEFKIRRKNL